MPIFTLPDPSASWSRALAGRSKVWIKRLDSVDRSKRDGYAFVGDFRTPGATDEAPVGTFYLVYYHQCRGSGKMDSRDVDLHKVTGDEEKPLQFVDGWDAGTELGWTLRVRDPIADLLEKHRGAEKHRADPKGLSAERQRLVDRIAEIDGILGNPVGDNVD